MANIRLRYQMTAEKVVTIPDELIADLDPHKWAVVSDDDYDIAVEKLLAHIDAHHLDKDCTLFGVYNNDTKQEYYEL